MYATIEDIAAALRRGPTVTRNGKEYFEIRAVQPTQGEIAAARFPHTIRSIANNKPSFLK